MKLVLNLLKSLGCLNFMIILPQSPERGSIYEHKFHEETVHFTNSVFVNLQSPRYSDSWCNASQFKSFEQTT